MCVYFCGRDTRFTAVGRSRKMKKKNAHNEVKVSG